MTEHLLATVTAETAGYQAGRYGGMVIFGTLFVFGIIKSIKTAVDERGNTKCALSLGLVLVSIGAIAAGGVVMKLGYLTAPIDRYFAMFFFSMLGLAFVLAIWGMIEFSRSDSYDSGLGLAIATIVIIGLLSVIAVPNFLRARAVAQARAKSGADPSSSSNSAPPSVVYREYGFSFQPPSRPWTEYNVKKINPAGTMGFMRSRPSIFFMIIAENGNADRLRLDAVVEVVKARMNGEASSMRLLKETSVWRAGMRGVQLETEARVHGAPVYFVQWIGLHKSHVYQLTCWGEPGSREKVQTESEQMFGRFQLVDGPAWTGMQQVKPQYAAAKAPRGDNYHRSDRFHYAVDLSKSDWTRWGSEGLERPDADFGATHQSGAHFALVPVCLMNQRFPQEGLRRAFAAVAGRKLLQMKERKRVMEKHFQGAEYEAESKQGTGACTHRLRVLEGKNYAYAIEVWAPKDNPKLESLWTDMLDRVDLLVPPDELSQSQQWSERDRKVHARFFTALAAAYSQPAQADKSNSCVRVAAEFGPTQTAKATK